MAMPAPLKMNNQSPLIPQGSLLEQKNKTRVRVKIAVIFVLALHGIGLLALLMQGCGHENAGTSGSGSANSNSTAATAPESPPANPAPGFAGASNAAPEATSTTSNAVGPSAAAAPTNQAQAPQPPEGANPSASAPQLGVSEYKVVKDDTLSKIARNHHVGLPALVAANPGVDSKRLKIDQTIHIPAPTAAAPAPSASAAAAGAMTEGADGQQVYTVKSNDTLIKIAHQFGLKVKALRAANLLKTDKIRVGQKLKIPAKTAANAETGPAPAATGSSSNPAAPSGR
jgi:peptidoglycan endopeptidase LytE